MEIFTDYSTMLARMEGRSDGLDEGEARGMARGKVDGRMSAAKAMLLDRVSGDLISKYTGVTEEQLVVLEWCVSEECSASHESD